MYGLTSNMAILAELFNPIEALIRCSIWGGAGHKANKQGNGEDFHCETFGEEILLLYEPHFAFARGSFNHWMGWFNPIVPCYYLFLFDASTTYAKYTQLATKQSKIWFNWSSFRASYLLFRQLKPSL